MSQKYAIPNLLTLSRMIVTLLLGIITAFAVDVCAQLPMLIALTGYIYLSDILDGKLARKWNCCSVFGVKADIAADLFYIVSQSTILVYRGFMHLGILLLVVGEFIVFYITSQMQTKRPDAKTICFDKFGRIAAGYYYLMPLSCLLFSGISYIGVFMLIICFIITVAAVLSRIQLLWKA